MPKAELAADDLGVADTHDRGKAQQLHSNAALSNLASAQRQASCLKELHVARGCSLPLQPPTPSCGVFLAGRAGRVGVLRVGSARLAAACCRAGTRRSSRCEDIAQSWFT